MLLQDIGCRENRREAENDIVLQDKIRLISFPHAHEVLGDENQLSNDIPTTFL